MYLNRFEALLKSICPNDQPSLAPPPFSNTRQVIQCGLHHQPRSLCHPSTSTAALEELSEGCKSIHRPLQANGRHAVNCIH